MPTAPRLALVIIGRNEVDHLRISLPAIRGRFHRVVYVDSGSTDGSQALARAEGAEVVLLDSAIPFTAARARNAGFAALQDDPQGFTYVQFIDGDCELIPEYLAAAVAYLDAHPDTGMVCGRRVERYPAASLYNTLCDIEWDTPVGDTLYCGGDVTVRSEALRQVGGYDASLIAGEDPEVCVRLRQAGWKIYRIDADMTRHDANMHRFSQWWRRNERAGYAFAEGAARHGAPPTRHWVREARSNWVWGGLFFAILLAGLLLSPWLWLLLLIFPLQGVRLAMKPLWCTRQRRFAQRLLFGMNCYLAKLPQFIGQLRFLLNRLTRRRQRIIEYK